ncbi:MAG: sulfite exporter TauE/SafE family protein [Clostridiales bacterium]|nr:sulfite exporter TauE/SafE family protein [Clostridiales bacterium]
MILFLIGLASGIVSGMGMGGGTVLIPALIFFAGIPQHLAQSVNLSVFFPISISALWIHTKNKQVRYKLAVKIIVAGMAGAFVGSRIAVSMPTHTLSKLFGSFILAMGIYELFRKPKSQGRESGEKVK